MSKLDEAFDKAWKVHEKKMNAKGPYYWTYDKWGAEAGKMKKKFFKPLKTHVPWHKKVLPVAAGIGIGVALHKNTSEKKASESLDWAGMRGVKPADLVKLKTKHKLSDGDMGLLSEEITSRRGIFYSAKKDKKKERKIWLDEFESTAPLYKKGPNYKREKKAMDKQSAHTPQHQERKHPGFGRAGSIFGGYTGAKAGMGFGGAVGLGATLVDATDVATGKASFNRAARLGKKPILGASLGLLAGALLGGKAGARLFGGPRMEVKKAMYITKTARTALTKHVLKSLNPNVFGAKDVARVAKGMGGGAGREAVVENVLKKHHLGKTIGRDITKRKAKTVAYSVKGSPKSVGSRANTVRSTEIEDIANIRATAKTVSKPINYETKALLGLQDVAKATKSAPASVPKAAPKRKFDWSGRIAKGKEKARRAGKKVKRVGYGLAAAGATVGVGSAVYAGQPTENINRQPRYYG